MTAPSRPPNEAERLGALREYRVLDTLPEESFDDLTQLAGHICDAPISLISLIDEHRQWFKSAIGVPFRETDRDVAFCAHGIHEPDVFTVENAEEDARFLANPLVTGEQQIRFYAGAPLIAPGGHAIGMLCVMDRRKRQLNASQIDALRVLSRQVIAQLELRRHAREVEESEARLITVFRSCPVPVSVHRLSDRTFVDVNTAFTRMLGFTHEDVLGRTVAELGIVQPGDSAAMREELATARRVHDKEITVCSKAGTKNDVLVSTEVIELQRELHAVTTFIDITERKRAQETATLLSAVVESSDDAIVGKDLNGIVTSWNRGAARLFGYTAEEMIGSSIMRLIPDDRLDEEHAIIAKIRSGEKLQHFETLRRTKDGRLIDVSVTASPIRNPEGAVVGVSKIARDVTERKRLERQFLRAQRMESIGTLAGGIAHDLNNVLAPILMSIDILREAVQRETDQELLTTLGRSAQRGAELVKQVLSFARGVEGERILVNLVPLVREIVAVMKDTFPKSIQVSFTHDRDLWRVVGDATQINQVLLNLCVNSRDAMPDGGTLNIRLANTTLDDTYAGMNLEARAGNYLVVSVEDTGQGIPVESRDRIFEPFFTTKEVGKGTGLGLSTTLAIVKSHGGFINVYSELGKGTKFKVYFPAQSSMFASAESVEEKAGLPRGNGELVLVVDDEAAVRSVAQRTLERFGYRVMVAAHGAEAVSIYAQYRTDIKLVLTDMAMPIMDGPALIVALKAINPRVKIIGSSGLAANGAVARAVGAGVHLFAPKPYTAETLLSLIQKALTQDP